MVSSVIPVCVCIFQKDDKRSVRERLITSAGHYRSLFEEDARADYLKDAGVNCGEPKANCRRGADVNLGDPDVDIWEINRTDRGKPYFPNQPELYFSISHSGDYWACAMADRPIGLDLQEHVSCRNETAEDAAARYLRMAKRFFHPGEAEYVKQDSYQRFFQVWAARESYVKYTGQVIDDHFSEFCVLSEDTDLREMEEKTVNGGGSVTAWHALDAWFQKMEFRKGYTSCVCTGNAVSMVIREHFD